MLLQMTPFTCYLYTFKYDTVVNPRAAFLDALL